MIRCGRPSAAWGSNLDEIRSALRRLTSAGLGVLLVSHKLREVAEISDRVVVLRRGRLVGTRVTGEVDDVELAALMMGSATAPTTIEEPATEAALGLAVAPTPLHRRPAYEGNGASGHHPRQADPQDDQRQGLPHAA